ncbi:homoserine dehydrogenase [Roseomonas sp. USHLN139]|uniref:homoserine dehydrogenase n=1 Tax=Roseomonas sp. USHLN139 TaxID=3081298 RepID=UPI003B02BE71
MQFQTLFQPAIDKPVRAALLGAGEFGLSLVAQARRMRGLEITAAFDLDPGRVAKALATMEVAHRRCASRAEAEAALAAGELAICERLDDLLSLPLDMVVEATGHAEAGARHAEAAIAAGIGVAMVSKETECVVGPLLAQRARQAGVPYTLVDGDQPSLLIGLVSWARLLGLPIVAAGKSSEYDFVIDPQTEEVTWLEHRVAAPGMMAQWHLADDRAGTVAAREKLLSSLPLRTVPDSCEMALVANATGILPDRDSFHAPLARTVELPDLYAPTSAGGLLSGPGKLDVFNVLRRPDESSFAGGVFVVVELADTATGRLFAGKGIPVSADRQRALIYNPSHLLGVEAPVSILAGGRLNHSIIGPDYALRVDLLARTDRDLPAGHVLAIEGTRHAVPGIEPLLRPAVADGPSSPLPYYMAVGRALTRAVPAGTVLTFDMVEAPADSALWRLRAEQTVG